MRRLISMPVMEKTKLCLRLTRYRSSRAPSLDAFARSWSNGRRCTKTNCKRTGNLLDREFLFNRSIRWTNNQEGKPFMQRLVRIRSIILLSGFVVSLEFTDGTTREVDLERYLKGPIFEALRADPARFREVSVDPCAGTICWPNGADIDPDVLYHGLDPAWVDRDPEGLAGSRVQDSSHAS
jgi:Protein of unknown function (DUF2442)